VAGPLTPRARAILQAVEREVAARLHDLERDVSSVAPRRAVRVDRVTPELLAALELGVAGLARGDVGARLGLADPAPVLDAVFGAGSAADARLPRAA
jgi:hypothetical protein